MRKLLLLSVSLAALSACDLSPDFKLPEVFKPASFKEDVSTETVSVEPATDGKWKRFDEHAKIEEFAWWRMFEDVTLDRLMEQAMKDNPSLEAAIERVNSARAAARVKDADLYPAVGVGVGPVRQRPAAAGINANMPPGTTITPKPYTLYDAQGTITYDLDLFGKNRATARAAASDAEAQADNYRAARLSLQAEVAQTYFRIASLRAELATINRTIATREDSLKLNRSKYELGSIDSLVVSTSETDLSNAKLDAATVSQSLALQEHALAALVGQPPSELKVDVAELKDAPPSVPAGLPSSLLERRPDIKQAEAAMAAANERIGVVRSGFFPDISLSIMGGFSSGELSDLFNWSSRTWLIGPLAGTMLTQPVFEGGRLSAGLAQSKADYAEAVANYRTAVLQAFREVEDQLSGLRYAHDQVKAADDAYASSKRAYDVASERYKVGYSSHLEYLDAERSFLNAKRNQVQVRGNRYITTVQLVRALGGSWQAPQAPVATAPAAQ